MIVNSNGARSSGVWKTPTTLASALVVSTPETIRGLYTLPSRDRRLSPKTLGRSDTLVSPSGKIEILRIAAISRRSSSRWKERDEEEFALAWPIGRLVKRERFDDATRGKGSTWSLYGDVCVIFVATFFFINHRRAMRSSNAAEAESRTSDPPRSILSRLHRRDGGSRARAGCQRKSSVVRVQGHGSGLRNAALLSRARALAIARFRFSEIIAIYALFWNRATSRVRRK